MPLYGKAVTKVPVQIVNKQMFSSHTVCEILVNKIVFRIFLNVPMLSEAVSLTEKQCNIWIQSTMVWKQECRATRKGGFPAMASTRFSIMVHSTSSSWMITSFLRILIAYSSSVPFRSANTTWTRTLKSYIYSTVDTLNIVSINVPIISRRGMCMWDIGTRFKPEKFRNFTIFLSLNDFYPGQENSSISRNHHESCQRWLEIFRFGILGAIWIYQLMIFN